MSSQSRPRRATAARSRPIILSDSDEASNDAETSSPFPSPKKPAAIKRAATKTAPVANKISRRNAGTDVSVNSIASPPPLKKPKRTQKAPTSTLSTNKQRKRKLSTSSDSSVVCNTDENAPPLPSVSNKPTIASKPPRKSNTNAIAKAPPPNKRRQSSRYNPAAANWNAAQLLADRQSLDYTTAQQIIRLFDEDNTIPFICRYRRELTGDLIPEQMRQIKQTYQQILNVKHKADVMIRHLEKEDICTDEIRSSIVCARSLDELEHLYEPYKPASKLALSERARAIGLQEPAELLLYGETDELPLMPYLNIDVPGLETLHKVSEGMQHIGAHLICKDARVLDELRKLQQTHRLQITSKLIPPKSADSKPSKTNTTKTSKSDSKAAATAVVDPSKFETYFDFRQAINLVRPHQILAINRGEHQKVLSVKVDVPQSLRYELHRFTRRVYLNDGMESVQREQFFEKAFEEAYSKKLQPLIVRQIRAELTKTAEVASVEVFATNLKQLLLTAPVRGERILGIDPGFTNGCKLALISEQAAVLATDVVYPHTRRHQTNEYGERLAHLMQRHACTLIALGNGTACRETERWLGALMKSGVLDGDRVRYCIVSEQGASIYSCGDVARQEFPTLDVNLISAVSIARRLGEPLGEFVKVEPRHLGVGMYQHDINEKLLAESLNEVVTECVSFVGVDINTASVTLLRHIAGLTATRAANIIKYREENGPFATREQLKLVKQIGAKTFVQCAGFVRIEPLTAGAEAEEKYNPLDSTWLHPESYDLARNICDMSRLPIANVGSAAGITKIDELLRTHSIAQLATELRVAAERVESVVMALRRELLRDYRTDLNKGPMFKQGLTSMSDLREGTAVSGAITNRTHFGCFVDIGVEKDGLIHSSQMGGMQPNIGDRVEALVKEVDVKRGRIQLKLVALC